jgi:hypothetical protein
VATLHTQDWFGAGAMPVQQNVGGNEKFFPDA